MNRVFAALFVALGVAACAPQTYQDLHVPVASGAGYGYSEQRLDERRFVVTYNAPVERGFSFAGEAGRQAAEAELARSYEFALARAAELALANGYTAFRVEDRKNDAHSRNYEAWSAPTGPSWAQQRLYALDEAYLVARVTLIVAMLPTYETGAYDANQTLATIRGRYAPRAA
jgi:hypothetical protein